MQEPGSVPLEGAAQNRKTNRGRGSTTFGEGDPAAAPAAAFGPGLVREGEAGGLEQTLVERARDAAQGGDALGREPFIAPRILERAAVDADAHPVLMPLRLMWVHPPAIGADRQEPLSDRDRIGRHGLEQERRHLAPATFERT